MKKFIFIITVFTIVFFTSCMSRYDTYEIIDWPAFNKEETEMVFLYIHSKTTSYSRSGGLIRRSVNPIIHIAKLNIETGEIIQDEELNFEKAVANSYGGYHETLWVNIQGIRGYDVHTLKEVVNEEIIEEKNSALSRKLPKGNNFEFNFNQGYMQFKALDAEEYQLDLKTLIATKHKKEDNFFAQNTIDRITYFTTNNDTFKGNYFELYKGDHFNTSKYDELINSKNYNGGDEKYELYKGKFFTQENGNEYFIYKLDSCKPIGEKYLNGNFLKDIRTNSVLHFTKPDGFIIAHFDIIGNNGTVLFTRIDENNKKIWETNIGLSDQISFISKVGNYILCMTNKSDTETVKIETTTIVLVHIGTGEKKVYTLFK